MAQQKQKRWIYPFVLTCAGNTAIAVILSATYKGQTGFFDIFIISQIIGLSICSWMVAGMEQLATSSWIRPGFVIAGCMILGLLTGFLLCGGYLHLVRGVHQQIFFTQIMPKMALPTVFFGVPMIYFFYTRRQLLETRQKLQEEQIRHLTMEKNIAQQHLKLLQAQIEPHFMFNTLANIQSLIDADPVSAKQMLEAFNDYLRLCLKQIRQEMIPLEQELNLVRQYLAVFKIRFGRRLEFEIREDPDARKVEIPPFIIQPLVENSIKYAVEPSVDGGFILVTASIENKCLIIKVTDRGEPLTKDFSQSGSGIGLANIRERLECVYGNGFRMEMTAIPGKNLKVTIEVPQ